MSHCDECPATGGNRIRCCCEPLSEAVERITALGDAAPAIAAWAPGHYINLCIAPDCATPKREFTAAKGSLHCLPCAIKAAESVGVDLSADEKARIDQLANNSGIYQLLARAGVPKPLADQMMAKPIGPIIGQTVRFRNEHGVDVRAIVCAADDPRRSGTYTSEKLGQIPTRPLSGNRKQRRAEQAKAR